MKTYFLIETKYFEHDFFKNYVDNFRVDKIMYVDLQFIK